MIINLNELKNTNIDLDGVKGQILLEGIHNGPQLVFRNANGVNIVSHYAIINSTDKENAIVLEDPMGVKIQSLGLFKINQSITVWGKAVSLTIDGVTILDAHTGIRINTARSHKNIQIRNCTIRGCAHEGVYIGPHYETRCKLVGATVENCVIENCGWDGAQFGNTMGFDLKGCIIRNNALSKEPGQDYQVTINPGSQGHIWRSNAIIGSIQSLESRMFLYKK